MRAAMLACAAVLLTLAGCGQTGPLYLPTAEERGLVAPPPPGNATTAPASGITRSEDESQVKQPTPDITMPRPGTR